MALPFKANIRLSCKGLSGSNTLAYFGQASLLKGLKYWMRNSIDRKGSVLKIPLITSYKW
jgi:hypothetical protein